MADPLKPQVNDELLGPLLAENGDAGVEQILSDLIQNHARPLIAGILKQKFSGWRNVDSIDDLQSEVILRLLARLQKFKRNPSTYSIWNFRDYVVATTSRVYVNYLRIRSPNRMRLQNSLMYLLTRDSAFFLKKDETGEAICGLREWMNSTQQSSLKHVDQISVDSDKIRSKLKTGYQDAASLRFVLKQVFAVSRGPIELNDVLKILVTVFEVHDRPVKNKPEAEELFIESLADARVDPERAAETSQFLKKMWNEITQLPVKQRVALLLNLKDSEGRDLLSIFPLKGISTFREIANILELSLDQFSGIWKEIPLGDLRIAELLGVTRQQVINLRKSGRERLIRRLREES